jgi:hypothetical protein
MVLALVAVNGTLFAKSYWHLPPGIASARYATIGASSPEGDFIDVGEREIRALDKTPFAGRYSVYSTVPVKASFAGNDIDDVRATVVSDGFFRLFDVRANLGTTPDAAHDGVLLTAGFWRDRLHGEDVVGKQLRLGGASLPILGVAQEDFRGFDSEASDVLVSARHAAAVQEFEIPFLDPGDTETGQQLAEQTPFYKGVVKLDSHEELEALQRLWSVRNSESIELDLPPAPGRPTKLVLGFSALGARPAVLDGIDLVPAKSEVIRNYVLVLSIQSAILMLLVAVSTSAFWISRASDRVAEFQVRVALGADRRAILTQLFAEMAPFVVLAGLFGLLLGWLQLGVVLRFEPFSTYLKGRIDGLDPSTVWPVIAMQALIASLALAAPFVTLGKSALRSRSLGQTAEGVRVRHVMFCVHWALVAVVIFTAVSGFSRARELGSAGWGGRDSPDVVAYDSAAMLEGLQRAFGDDTPALMSTRPLERLQGKKDFFLPGDQRAVRRMSLYTNEVTPEAFSALGVPMLAGKTIDEGAEGQAVLSAAAARSFGLDPAALVGRSIVLASAPSMPGPERSLRVVGVVGDIHYSDVRAPAEAVVYTGKRAGTYGTAIFTTPLLPSAADDDPEVRAALAQSASLGQLRDRSVQVERVLSEVVGLYSLVALVFLALGIVSEARVLVARQDRVSALKLAVGWPLNRVIASVLALPLGLALGSMAIVLASVRLAAGESTLLDRGHFAWTIALAAFSLLLFMAMAYAFIYTKARATDLGTLLRVEH